MALTCSIPLQVLLILAFVSLVSLPCHQASNTILPNHNNATDRVSLISFKSAIYADPQGVLSSWNDTVDLCRWQGITCSGRRHPGRVIALELASADLVGIIPPAVANLTFLRRMDLSSNQFHGQIPLNMARMHRLQDLELGHNSISGRIPPELSHCKGLRTINFTYNMLEGSIPSELGLLLSLQNLDINANSITGEIPPSLANVSTITYLDLSNNQISGGIPPSLRKLSKLTYIDFSKNYLEGAFPPSFWNISSLEILDLSVNQLYGTLPPDLGHTLPNLRFINLGSNKLYGPIPLSLSNASSLYSIQLGKNNFSGTIPPNLGSLQSLTWLVVAYNQLEAKGPNHWSFLSALTNCTRLHILQLDYNNLGSMLPNAVANLSSTLQYLTMGGNYIHGSIPAQIGNLVNLAEVGLGPNLLTGSIPNSIGLIKHLNGFALYENNLSGELPSTLGNLTQLTGIYFGGNSFTGSIPASLGHCQQLETLDLSQNMLTGSIPKEILAITSFSIVLNLEYNLLTGKLPVEVGGLINLEALSVASNKLSGEIPSNLGQCLVLEQIYLGGNFFQGSIPKSLSALRGLRELDLTQNNLSGEIPSFLEDIKGLYILNLSFNNFEGQVPSNGVFANVSALSVLGNNKLCGGIPQLNLPACSFQAPKERHHYAGLAAIVSVSGVLLLSFLVSAGCWISSSRRKPQEVTTSSPTKLHLNVSYGQLVRATDGFSDANLLGSGHFGSVYKGRLDDGNKTKVVAVKVLHLQQIGASKSFAAECDTLRSIRHRNLLKVLTACSSVDPQGNDFKALVFEFLANGSLENWLHSEASNSSAPKKLNLMQRLNIAIDVASALEYLHCHGQTPIVHCDLKPSNILLDEDLVAHLGDFGLAKFLENVTNYSTDSFGLKGTIGYLAPEYGVGNQVSILGDVYSYGIVLLEMFTGKRPTDDAFKDGLSLVRFVEMAFPDQVMSIMDPSMFLEERNTSDDFRSVNDTGTLVEGNRSDDFCCINDAIALVCVTSVLRIGLLCTKHLPTERMEMKAASNELHSIRKTFLRN